MRPLALILLAAGALAFAAPRDVEACGGFFSRRATKLEKVPSLQVEQVLIIHDPLAGQEHFIRELTFRDAKEPFGFVVPIPSRPTVAKVDKSPFEGLARLYPPEAEGSRGLGGIGSGFGDLKLGAGGGAAPAVKVLSQERIGSFTAFVLAATDSDALKAWLDKNELATTPASDAWLQHYVSLGFFYVAFRYEVPAAKPGEDKTKSETVRISFASALPFYPYKEPDHATAPGPRVLAVWLMSAERFVPVALNKDAWQQPWSEPRRHVPTTPQDLHALLGSDLGALLPKAGPAWTVQTFEDQKTSRRGWGDVVLVHDTPHDMDIAKLGNLAASLKP